MMKTTNRLQALDTFRGVTIASMIIVNMPGSWSHVYAPLRHASWHGCTPTDLIFPFFLFIVGAAMAYSLRRFDGITAAAAKKIIKRVLLIFLIGLLLNAFPFQEPLSELRIPGVLQRIALAYGLAAFCCLWLDRNRLIILSAAILLSYWLVLVLFSAGDPYGLESSLVRSIDLKLLGASHLWGGQGIPFDPEGLLSTFPAAVTVIIGFLTGKYIQNASDLNRAVRVMLAAGIIALAAGWLWGLVMPINKSLWTGSYGLYTAGWALLILALLLWIIDVRRLKRWTFPFLVFGVNPLLLYIIAGVWTDVYLYLIQIPSAEGGTVNAYGWIYSRLFVPLAGDLNGSLLFAIAHVFVFWLILLVMYKKRIFIKL